LPHFCELKTKTCKGGKNTKWHNFVFWDSRKRWALVSLGLGKNKTSAMAFIPPRFN